MAAKHEGVITLTIDVGGTGIKMLRVDARGRPLGERARELTPRRATPRAVLAAVRRMLAAQGPFDRVSVGFPGVVVRGVVQNAPNLGTGYWRNFDLQRALARLTRKPTRVLNDADLQGLGVIRGRGVEMVLTLGTGLGCGIYVDGRLVPNVQLAHHPFRDGHTYEELVGNAALEQVGRKRWRKRVSAVFEQLDPIFNYETLFVGGGNARKLDPENLPPRVRLFDNVAGMRGGVKLWPRAGGRGDA